MNPEDYRTFVSDANRFDSALFQKLADTDDNVVCSSITVLDVLGAAYTGARGETAAEMTAALRSRLDRADFNAGINRMTIDLRSRGSSPTRTSAENKSVRLELAQAIWADQGLIPTSGYLNELSANYDAGVFGIDLKGSRQSAANAINRWAADHTEGKILELIHPSALSAASLLLTATLYFWGSWAEEFDPRNTHQQQFYPRKTSPTQVLMMHSTRVVEYAEADGAQMVVLPYHQGQLSMWIVLPDSQRFAEVRTQAQGEWLENFGKRMHPENVAVTLPKFQFAWGQSLKTSLRALGMNRIFDPSANLSGISPASRVYVDDVLSRTFVNVGESGTEAASASAVVAKGESEPPTKQFVANRPFLFWVRDVTGLTLLHGQVVNLPTT